MDQPQPAADLRARLRRVRGILDADQDSPRRLAARWAVALMTLAFLAVVYCTLFPFNFTVPRGMTLRQAAAEWDWRLYDPSNLSDWLDNVLMFIPFGFALACAARARGIQTRWLIPLIGLLAGAVCSTCIELLQLWLPGRDSAIADVLANSAGSLLGAGLFAAFGNRLLEWAGASLKELRRRLNFGIAGALVVVLCGFSLIGPYHLRHHGRELSGWNPKYVLALGSEPWGTAKPWRGTVFSLDLADASLGLPAVDRIYRGESLGAVLPHTSTLYAYVPVGQGEYPERNGAGPSLRWTGDPSARAEASVSLSGEHYLVSTRPLDAFSRGVARTNAFTTRIVLRSAEPYQGERRVIAQIGDDVSNTNFTLMQDGANLLVHIRTMLSGNRPAWIVRDLFTEPGPHDLLISYAAPNLHVYIDSPARAYAVDVPLDFSEAERFVSRFDRLPISGFHLEIYRLLYYFVLFVPIGLLLGVMVSDPRTSVRVRQAIVVAGVLIPCLLMQGVLVFIDHRPLRSDNVVSNLIAPALAMLAMAYWLTDGSILRSLRPASNVISPRGR